MNTRPTPETDALSIDPAIEKRDVPARVWRKMATLERQRDEAVEMLRALMNACDTGERNPDGTQSGVHTPDKATIQSCRAFLTRLEKEKPCKRK